MIRIEERYVILMSNGSDEWEKILPRETSKLDAIYELESAWAYLTPSEKKRQQYTLTILAVAVNEMGEEEIVYESEFPELPCQAGYSPIVVLAGR